MPASVPLRIPRLQARRFVRHALGFETPWEDVGSALRQLGHVQIDPINICGRMHDHILRLRVAGYREGDLTRHLHGGDKPLPPEQRRAFEHHLPSTNILVALELAAWPYLQSAMRARAERASAWSGRLTPPERDLSDRIFAHIQEHGPSSSDAIVDPRRADAVWGAATLVKSTMQKLFFHGHLLIAWRDNGRRWYDLPQRVLPPEILSCATPSAEETARWEVHLKLRQRRLCALSRAESQLVSDLAVPVKIEDGPTVYCLTADRPLLESCPDEPLAREPRLIAPLDPLIYDRVLTRKLWDFDYTWEVYTPPAKRKRGYYALPVLAGTELVGDVDLRADRTRRRLEVVSRRVRRGYRTQAAVAELAAFLNLR